MSNTNEVVFSFRAYKSTDMEAAVVHCIDHALRNNGFDSPRLRAIEYDESEWDTGSPPEIRITVAGRDEVA